jgi:precorrin-2 dehydrogenase/sirohydrochlorin ferrochelatase
MTVPLALDLTLLPTLLAGGGRALEKRLGLLDAECVPHLAIYALDPEPSLVAAAGDRLMRRLPSEAEIAAARVLFVAGLPHQGSAVLADIARRHRVLVNVEDDLALCDFHVPAILRRGDLALSISTGGASPTLARRLKSHLATLLFPPSWEERLRRIAALRTDMRASGADMATVAAATEALIEREGWLANGREEPAPPHG